MQLSKGMMLDFIKLGNGIIVSVDRSFESTVGKHPFCYGDELRTDDRVILTNKYDVHVLIDGTMYKMHVVIHFEWEGDLCRIEYRVLDGNAWSPSGLAELLWHGKP